MSIRAVVKLPDMEPAVVEIENSLDSLQKLVGGYIETVTFAEDCVAICNEEGRLMGLAHNTKFLGVDFVGPVVLVATDGEDFTGLTEDRAVMLIKALSKGG